MLRSDREPAITDADGKNPLIDAGEYRAYVPRPLIDDAIQTADMILAFMQKGLLGVREFFLDLRPLLQGQFSVFAYQGHPIPESEGQQDHLNSRPDSLRPDGECIDRYYAAARQDLNDGPYQHEDPGHDKESCRLEFPRDMESCTEQEQSNGDIIEHGQRYGKLLQGEVVDEVQHADPLPSGEYPVHPRGSGFQSEKLACEIDDADHADINDEDLPDVDKRTLSGIWQKNHGNEALKEQRKDEVAEDIDDIEQVSP